MSLSVIIPARNEEKAIAPTLEALYTTLTAERIAHEIIVVEDHSTDGTWENLQSLTRKIPTLRPVKNAWRGGFGLAVRYGFEQAQKDLVVVVMADGSDLPQDVVRYYHVLQEKGLDCVFGSRFIRGGSVQGYPFLKLLLNRFMNLSLKWLFGNRLNDTSNAFKMYRKEVIEGCKPLLSRHFNLTVEIPIKAMVRGYRYEVIPICWRERTTGSTKLLLKEMGSQYLFTILYCLLEKYLLPKDYREAGTELETKKVTKLRAKV